MSKLDQVTKRYLRDTFNFKWKMLKLSLLGLFYAIFPFMGNTDDVRAEMQDLEEHPDKLFYTEEERERMGWLN